MFVHVRVRVCVVQFEYYVTCAVCSRTGEKELQILKKFTQVFSVVTIGFPSFFPGEMYDKSLWFQ